jgi:hypothetical protein
MQVTVVTCARGLFRGTVKAVRKNDTSEFIDWDARREGYVDLPRAPMYAPVPKPASKPSGQRYPFSISTEERLGSLLAAGGTIWATYVATVDYASLWQMRIFPPGPMEVCALGVLIWLHAKWRRSTKVD